MVTNLLLLLAGLALLIGGGEALVRGSVAVARRANISPLVIGMTIVAFGTSSPELVVNLTGIIRDTGAISFGNVVGSNIANIGLILAICVLIRPLEIHSSVIFREIPMMLLAGGAMLVMGLDFYLDGEAAAIHRSDGILLLLIFTVFLYYTFGDIFRENAREAMLAPPANDYPRPRRTRLPRLIGLIALGLAGLIAGGSMTITGGVGAAEALGVSQVIIGLTVIAVGTSLPEVAASIIATIRGHADLAVGNLIGSNIFNILFIMGLSATVEPIAVPAGGMLDLTVMLFLSLVLVPLAVTHRNRLMRWEGAVLLALYVGYLTLRAVTAVGE